MAALEQWGGIGGNNSFRVCSWRGRLLGTGSGSELEMGMAGLGSADPVLDKRNITAKIIKGCGGGGILHGLKSFLILY